MSQEKKVIKKNDVVIVIATEKAKHMVAGKAYEVHSHVAEQYEKKGLAKVDKKKTEDLKSDISKRDSEKLK